MNKMMSLFVALSFAACSGKPAPAPETPAAEPVATPSAEPVAPAADAQPAATASSTVLGLDATTQIQVRHILTGEENTTIEDLAAVQELVTALGDGPILEVVPKCMPKVQLVFSAGSTELATVSFCDATIRQQSMRIDGPKLGTGTISVADAEPFKRFLD